MQEVANRVAKFLAPAPKGKGKAVKVEKKGDGLNGLAHTIVVITGVSSCYLNGRAAWVHSQEVDSAVLGVIIPLFVMLMFRTASKLYRRYTKLAIGRKRSQKGLEAIGAVVVGLAALGLSLVHCTESIATMLHSAWWLALPLAITIDCGLVVCEWLTVSCE